MNAQDSDGRTPLHFAAAYCSQDILQVREYHEMQWTRQNCKSIETLEPNHCIFCRTLASDNRSTESVGVNFLEILFWQKIHILHLILRYDSPLFSPF